MQPALLNLSIECLCGFGVFSWSIFQDLWNQFLVKKQVFRSTDWIASRYLDGFIFHFPQPCINFHTFWMWFSVSSDSSLMLNHCMSKWSWSLQDGKTFQPLGPLRGHGSYVDPISKLFGIWIFCMMQRQLRCSYDVFCFIHLFFLGELNCSSGFS